MVIIYIFFDLTMKISDRTIKLFFLFFISFIFTHSELISITNNIDQKNPKLQISKQLLYEVNTQFYFTTYLLQGITHIKVLQNLNHFTNHPEPNEIIKFLAIIPSGNQNQSNRPYDSSLEVVNGLNGEQKQEQNEKNILKMLKQFSNIQKNKFSADLINTQIRHQINELIQSETQKLESLVSKNQISLSSNYEIVRQPNFYRFYGKFLESSIRLKPKIDNKVIRNRQFENVGFYHNLPLEFVDRQVYQFEGVVTNIQLKLNKTDKINLIMLSKINFQPTIVCEAQIYTNLQFNMSCQMGTKGYYFMYIFVGSSGKYSQIQRRIISNLDLIRPQFLQPSQPEPKGLRLECINNSLYAVWDSDANITNITFYQQKEEKLIKNQYLLSNNHKRFKIPFKDFDNFLPKKTYAEISHANTMNGSLNIIFTKFTSKRDKFEFQALNHAFVSIQDKVKMSPQLPWKLEVGEKFQFNISFTVDVKSTIYITQPDFQIKKTSLLISNTSGGGAFNSVIPAGTILILQLSFQKAGTNILQINNLDGLAVINRPIYVGGGYPLIPDYKDLIPSLILRKNISLEQIYRKFYSRTTEYLKVQQPTKTSSNSQKVQYVLELVNGLRRKYNSTAVQLDETLNRIAQNHTNDMILRNYISHTNIQGEKVKQRAIKFNFQTLIGENICKTSSLIENNLQLQRSGVHLENIINRAWRRVGIGINLTSNNEYVITYLYSIRDIQKLPVTEHELISIKKDLLKLIIQNNRNIEGEDQQLSKDLNEWMESQKDQKILIEKLRRTNFMGLSLKINFSEDLIQRMREGYKISGYQNFSKVGIGLTVNKFSGNFIQLYLIFI